MHLHGQAEKRAAELALLRKKEEAQREKERQEALKERAATFRAREASRAQVRRSSSSLHLPHIHKAPDFLQFVAYIALTTSLTCCTWRHPA